MLSVATLDSLLPKIYDPARDLEAGDTLLVPVDERLGPRSVHRMTNDMCVLCLPEQQIVLVLR